MKKLAAGTLIGILVLGTARFALAPPEHPVHYHANFAVFIAGERLDLSGDRYMEDAYFVQALEQSQRAESLSPDDPAILARLGRARVIGSDETAVRVAGRTHWNWVFQNERVVVHVIRPGRGRAVVGEVLGGHRPQIWVSDLCGAQRGQMIQPFYH